MALLEVGIARSDLRHSSWTKVKFKEDFLNIYHFTLPFCQAFFKRWINNKLKSYIVIFTSYFLSYFVVPYYTHFNEKLWDHGGSNSLEKLWISNVKTERWLLCSEKQRVVGNRHVFVACQSDVVNKQLVSPLSWNNSFSKTSFGESYILTI